MIRILGLCTHNSARSQMGEGCPRKLWLERDHRCAALCSRPSAFGPKG
jgi:protein-tyrosine-phosphatase